MPSPRPRAPRLRTAAVVLALAGTLAACGGDDDSSAAAPQGPADAGTRTISIALSPILPTFNVFVAESKGFFDAQGLDVTIKKVGSSPLIAQAVQSGEVDLGTRNFDGIVSAIASGVDFKVVYPIVMYDDKQPDAFVMLRSDLAGRGLKALEGQSLAVTLGSQQAEAVKRYLRANGVDVDAVKFVEVTYGDMTAAFANKAIAGAHVVEPFITRFERDGIARSMGPHLGYVSPRYLINAAFGRGEWMTKNPDTVRRFVQAMNEATTLIRNDPQSLLPLAAEWTGTAPDILSSFYPSRYVVATEVAPQELQGPIDFNVDAGFHKRVALADVLAADFPLAGK